MVSYVVEVMTCTVERWRPDAVAPEDWLGRPIPELGGAGGVEAGELAVRLEDARWPAAMWSCCSMPRGERAAERTAHRRARGAAAGHGADPA
ncbi:MAG: hypothetical protein R2755_07830 [Acidimicrobiales bacterium]